MTISIHPHPVKASTQSKKKGAPWQCAKCQKSTVDFRTHFSCQKCSFDICKQCVDLLQSTFSVFAKLDGDSICQLVVVSNLAYLVTKSGKLYSKPLQSLVDASKAIDDPTLKLVKVLTEEKIVKVAASSSHVLILLSSGQVQAQGCNTFGQLGAGDCANRETFVPVSFQDPVIVSDIAAGESHSVFVLSDGTVLGCGLSTTVRVLIIIYSNIHIFYLSTNSVMMLSIPHHLGL